MHGGNGGTPKSEQNFKLQLHTADSFNVKQNINHGLYEELRLPATSVERQKVLITIMRHNSSEIGFVQNSNIDQYIQTKWPES